MRDLGDNRKMRYLVVFCLFLNMGSFASAQNHAKVSKQLAALDSESTVDVIVQYRVHPGEAHFRRARNLGASEKTHFRKLSAAAYNIPASAIASLANDPDVVFVSVDHKLKSHLDISAKTINAPLLWASNYT